MSIDKKIINMDGSTSEMLKKQISLRYGTQRISVMKLTIATIIYTVVLSLYMVATAHAALPGEMRQGLKAFEFNPKDVIDKSNSWYASKSLPNNYELYIGSGRAKGSLHIEEFGRALKTVKGSISSCLQQYSDRPYLRFVVQLNTNSNGRVKQANISQLSINNDDLDSCIVGVIKGLTLNRSRRTSSAMIPIIVKPKDSYAPDLG